MSGAVFLSYASEDADAARRLSQALAAAGVEVWFDQSELRGGDAWDQKIRRQIKECALFVPLVSSSTQARSEGYFRREWRMAVERTQDMADHVAFLLPVVLGDIADRDAHVPEAFREVQWTRMQAGREPDPKFTETVRGLLLGSSQPRGPQPGGANRDLLSGRTDGSPTAADPKSVAVLAFANRSEDKENEYFSDGISEELINALTKVPGLKVSARTSAFHFKAKDLPISEIARQLGVSYVVEGSVRKVGDRVRITAQLIKAADGFHVWSDTFTRDLKDIFAVQDEIAGLIATNLALKLGSPAKSIVVNPEAFQLFLKAREIYRRSSVGGVADAVALLRASLAIDQSAVTWALLSMAEIVTASTSSGENTAGFEAARVAAKRAIEIDPLLPDGHVALATVQYCYDFDWNASALSLQRANTLAPGDANTLSILSNLAQVVGRKERALELGKKGLDLDPLSSIAGYIYGKALFQAGMFEELAKNADFMIGANPGSVYGHTFKVYAALLLGRIDEASVAAEQVSVGLFRSVCIAHVRHAQGRKAESDAALKEAKAKYGEFGAYQIANVHGFRGEVDEAFEWLDISYRQRDPGMTWLINDAFMNSLRSDPRWSKVMRLMKLEDDQLRAEPALWKI